MTSVQECIEKALDQAGIQGIEEQKRKYRKILLSMLGNVCGVPSNGTTPIAEELNVSQQALDLLYTHGHRLYTSGQFLHAAAAFALLSFLDTQNPNYSFSLAACYHMMKDYPLAIVNYKTSFYSDTSNPLPLYHCADCFIKLEQPHAAFMHLELLKSLIGDNPKYAPIKERAQLMLNTLHNELIEIHKKNEGQS